MIVRRSPLTDINPRCTASTASEDEEHPVDHRHTRSRTDLAAYSDPAEYDHAIPDLRPSPSLCVSAERPAGRRQPIDRAIRALAEGFAHLSARRRRLLLAHLINERNRLPSALGD
ncbi:MAG: hypothetical protein GVY25_14900 [Bacteroidetes bacterium]|nr:hypothetical protein [Bacteroidota bacterium]